jgi:hypothetical protein
MIVGSVMGSNRNEMRIYSYGDVAGCESWVLSSQQLLTAVWLSGGFATVYQL